MVKALHDELTKLGLTATTLETLDTAKFSRLHRKVGKIQLYGLTTRVNRALEITGCPERVTEGKYRSLYSPEMLTEPLIKFCSPKKFQPRNKKALDLAISRVKKKFSKGKTQPISLAEAYSKLMFDKADHFAGLPTLGSKAEDEDALYRAEQCWRGKCPPPAIIGHRGKNTEVARAVWMFPFEWHIVEACFYYALYDVVKRNQIIYPVGVISERRYTMRQYSAMTRFNTKFSIDYSGFDASLGTQMIGIAFDILSEMLELDEKQMRVWKRVQTYFATCPFLAPDGKVYKGRRGGVPSGSMFTQMVDSVCNAVAIEYAMICEQVKSYRYLVYGDDSWTILEIGEAPQEFLAKIEAHVRSLGLKMNVSKTEYAAPEKAIVFCGHYDIKRGRPIQDCVDKLCFPERPNRDISTPRGKCERLVAYMADADCLALNAVYLSYYYNQSVDDIFKYRLNMNLTEVLGEGGGPLKNKRHLPGILQIIQEVPREASSLMKIRSAI